MGIVVLIFVLVLSACAAGAALWLDRAVRMSHARLRVLGVGHGDARLLLGARRRFRRRQQTVENVVDTGTIGVQSAHRTIGGLFGADPQAGAGVYDNVRAFNRNIGRTLSSLFAPGPKQHTERLATWRENNDPADEPEPRER